MVLALAAPCMVLRSAEPLLDPNFAPAIGRRMVVPSGFDVVQPDGKILGARGAVRHNADGSRDLTFVPLKYPNVAKEMCAAPDGKIIVLSQSLNGSENTIIQFNADGSFDRLMATSDQLVAMAMQPDGKLLVLPLSNFLNFTINGIRRNDIARLNRDGSVDTTFDSGGPALHQTGGNIRCLAVQSDGKILLGGSFERFHGADRGNLVRLNSNGTVDLTFSAFVGPLSRFFVAPNGKILVAINSGNTATPAHLTRLNANGSVDANIGRFGGGDSNTFDEINALAFQPDGRLLVGGNFSNFNGVARTHLVRLNVDGTLDATFSANAADLRPIQRLAVQPEGQILFAESETSVELFRLQPSGSLIARSGTQSPRSSVLPPAFIAGAAFSDGKVAVAGDFDSVGGTARPGLAIVNASGAPDPSFAPNATFTRNLISSDPLSWRIVVEPNRSMVVIGPFSGVGVSRRSGIARFLADGSLDPTLNPIFTSTTSTVPIKAVAPLADGRIVVGGTFSSANLAERRNLAAFRPDGSLDTSFDMSVATDGAVRLMAPRPGGGLFVAGDFSIIGGKGMAGIAAITGAGALDPLFTTSTLLGNITAIAPLADGGVMVGVSNPRPGPFSRGQLLRLRPNGDVDPAFITTPDMNVTFNALMPEATGGIIASFSVTETKAANATTNVFDVRHHVRRFTASGAFDPRFDLGTGPSSPVTSFIPLPDGSVLGTGGFTALDDLPISPGLFRLRPGNAGSDPPNLLLNISTRGQAGTGDNVLTVGFVIKGSQPETVLLRAVGPSLNAFGISNLVPNPSISVQSTVPVASNDDWSRSIAATRFNVGEDFGFNVALTGARLGAFPLTSQNDAALVLTLPPGAYTAQVGAGGSPVPGISLVEIYHANVLPGDRRLINISTRGLVSPGERALIAGFTIGGTQSKNVLVRAIGPTLAAFGVASALADPRLEIYRGATKLVENDNWAGGALLANTFVAVGAFPLAADSRDAALLLALPPGSYTALVSGAANTTGVALVEVYEVP